MAGVVLNKMSWLIWLAKPFAVAWHENNSVRRKLLLNLDFKCEKISAINFKRLKIYYQTIEHYLKRWLV